MKCESEVSERSSFNMGKKNLVISYYYRIDFFLLWLENKCSFILILRKCYNMHKIFMIFLLMKIFCNTII